MSADAAVRISRRFQAALRDHVTANHDVAFYADYLRVSPDYLARCVKHATGHTPKRVVQDKLMDCARKLLKENLTMAEVARRLGFESSAYFSRFVRRLTGTTPTNLQKTLQKQS